MTETIVKEIEKFTRDLLPYKLIVRLEAINVTPWWGGTVNADTRLCIDDDCSNKDKVIYALPTTNTLKGALRWVIRAATTCICNNYREVERQLKELLGGIEDKFEDSKIIISIKSEKCNDPDYINFNDLKSMLQQFINKYKSIKTDHLLSILELIGNTLLRCDSPNDSNVYKVTGQARDRDELHKKAADLYSMAHGIIGNKADEFFLLFSIPRARLLSMKLSSKLGKTINANNVLGAATTLYKLLPVKPGCVKINVEVLINERFSNSDVAKLITLALIYTLTIHGIGKATSRGFGRFKIDKNSLYNEILSNEEMRKMQELLDELYSNNPDEVKQSIMTIHNELVNVAKSVFRIQSKTGQRVPCLKNVDVEVIRFNKIPCPFATLELTSREAKESRSNTLCQNLAKDAGLYTLAALAAIGKSTLKACWKIHACLQVREPGVYLHTWPLGLPRWQQETGYTLMKLDRDPDCIHVDQLKSIVEEIRRKSHVKEIRRKSQIIMFPLNNLIVLLNYKTVNDHDKKIYSKPYLVHVGKHGKHTNIWRHVVSIQYVLNNLTIQSQRKECGLNDRGGILQPNGQANKGSIVNALDTTWNWIKQLLRSGI